MKKPVVIIPCSGIGKAYGTICREAVYEVVERRRPDKARTLCLGLLTKGDEEAIDLLKESPCISVDGCAKKCSYKNIERMAEKTSIPFTIMDLFRKHRDLNPNDLDLGTVLHLGEGGKYLVHLLADEICHVMDRMGDKDE
ncbi:MAG: putative zinc-binding protein [Thermodesulfobacteriota bacterium]|nr:putative zinc-binding protein [Thermodesulfobacteriota bacterium]